MSDIVKARGILLGVIARDDVSADAKKEIGSAYDLLFREYHKSPARRGITTKPEHRAAVIAIMRTPEYIDMPVTKIAARVFGDACAGGRVSEIIGAYSRGEIDDTGTVIRRGETDDTGTAILPV